MNLLVLLQRLKIMSNILTDWEFALDEILHTIEPHCCWKIGFAMVMDVTYN
jgi:hypothetical protein